MCNFTNRFILNHSYNFCENITWPFFQVFSKRAITQKYYLWIFLGAYRVSWIFITILDHNLWKILLSMISAECSASEILNPRVEGGLQGVLDLPGWDTCLRLIKSPEIPLQHRILMLLRPWMDLMVNIMVGRRQLFLFWFWPITVAENQRKWCFF